MFTDPISVAAQGNVPALVLTRVSNGPFSSTWYDGANRVSLLVKHSNPTLQGDAPETHYLQYSWTKSVTVNSVVRDLTASVSLSARIPKNFIAAADKSDVVFMLGKILGDAELGYARFVNYES